MARYSLISFWSCALIIVATAFLYYPRWKQSGTEATISWDVSGYYLYLPAALIYGDLKHLAFFPEVAQKYHPGPEMGQAYKDAQSGNFVMKYSSGQALQFLPWFLLAHAVAPLLGYPADGFSLPYQVAISWGSLLVALIGLWFARKILLYYFSDKATAAALFCMVWGSNYLNYTAIDGAMTHNWLFTVYCLLIFCTIQFYQKPNWTLAVAIGLLCGWATLTRPTELIVIFIPVFWAYNKQRWSFLVPHWRYLVGAATAFLSIASVQLFYWKWATGHWLVYSYQDQQFDWLHPSVVDVFFSFKAGWLVYSPIMIFSLLGLYAFWKQKRAVAVPVVWYLCLFTYITCAWSIWWYGGSFGARSMVQSYALWLFPMAAFAEWLIKSKWASILFPLFFSLMIGHNLWWTHQAHRGGLFLVEEMTMPYFMKVYGKEKAERDWLKLLDSRDEFRGGERREVKIIWQKDFEKDSTIKSFDLPALSGQKSLVLNEEMQYSPSFLIPVTPTKEQGWLRVNMTVRCAQKEWESWRMAQSVIRISAAGKIVRERMIRLHRLLDEGETRQISMDIKIPTLPFDKVELFYWNADGNKTLLIDNITVEQFIY